MLRVIVSSSLVLFQDKHFAVTWIREKTDAATIMFLYLRCDRAVFFHSPLKAPLVQMSVTAQFTEFAVASGTEFRFPCWSNDIQFKQRSSAMNRAENRAEQYRALAEDVCNRASREPNPIVKGRMGKSGQKRTCGLQGRRTTLEARDRPTTRSGICWSARETDVTLQRHNAAADYLPVPRSRRSITASTSAPARITMQEIHIQVMKPMTAPSEP